MHQLRAGYVSDLYDSGIDLTMVSKIIGHKSVDTTNKHYLDLQNKEIARAVKRHPSFSIRKEKLKQEDNMSADAKEDANKITNEAVREYIKNNLNEIIEYINKKSSSDAGNN